TPLRFHTYRARGQTESRQRRRGCTPTTRQPAAKTQARIFTVRPPSPPQPYTLSLPDALPIPPMSAWWARYAVKPTSSRRTNTGRSEEHTSELQSRRELVCRLLLEKKNAWSLHGICSVAA